MSLWLYYAWHSGVNQIKKLFKTWVAIVILCCVGVGVLFGAVGGIVSSFFDDEIDDAVDEVTEEVIGDYVDEDDEIDIKIRDDVTGETVAEIKPQTIVDMAATGLCALILVLMMLTADKTSIFLPADTVLLFTAPMKPQKVLAFRLACTMGMFFFLFIYFLCLSPTYTIGMNISAPVVISVMVGYIMLCAQSVIVKMTLYMYCAGDKKKKDIVNYTVYGLLAAVLAGFAIFMKTTGVNSMAGNAILYVTHANSRWIPIVGWIKGMIISCMEENYLMAAVYFGLEILLSAACIVVMMKMKADFYEPALAKSEELANMQSAMLENRSAVRKLSKRQQDKREKIRKDGIGRGSGANVIFWKEMYNRFRFAQLGIFTKTFETYALFSVGVVAVLAYKGIRTMLPGAIVLAASVFIRAFGNPMNKDTQVHYFAMIPEKPRKKLWYSLLAGTANTAMDVVLPLLACTIIGGGSVIDFLVWLLVIVTLDFYSTVICTFIGLTVPNNLANGFKQFVLIMFIYVGMVPAGLAIGFSIYLGYPAVGALIASVINAGVGAIFFNILPCFF